MDRIYFLKNEIMYYDWGSRTAIADLLGNPSPSETPQAELWMGDHPKGPSQVRLENKWVPLPEFIATDPVGILGKEVSDRFENHLPFLFKVLAASQPLSIQAHPDKATAKEGYRRETASGIDPADRKRNYKDDRHKPECICALTSFWGMCGFRNIREILPLFKKVLPPGSLESTLGYLENAIGAPKTTRELALKNFFQSLMRTPPKHGEKVIETAAQRAAELRRTDPAFDWMARLFQITDFRTDIGVFSPLYLNLVRLKPGEAMYLPPGRLHAYLDGLGIEIMANSDNTLRGGLTRKHVDLEQLLKVVQFEEMPIEIINPDLGPNGERRYETPAPEFELSMLIISGDLKYECSGKKSVEIILCTQGEANIYHGQNRAPITIRKGYSVLIPACVERFKITGEATLYKATVPA